MPLAALDARLIENWRGEIRRLWTMRIALGSAAFWSVLLFLYAAWPALIGYIPLGAFFAVGVAISVAVGIGRILKQPGMD